MSPRRRTEDHPEYSAPRRREDILEDLVKHGSRNFRRYRRRAYAAFAVLALTNAFAIYRGDRNDQEARAELGRASSETQYRSCISGNKVRIGILTYLGLIVDPDRRERALKPAREIFGPRNCREAIAPIVDAAPSPP